MFTEEELLATVAKLNADPNIDGYIVQLPLPRHISEQRIIEAIDYRKDVDGFHPINVGRMSIGLPCFLSATPAGIIELLARYDIDTKRQTLCRARPQQYSRQAGSYAHDAETQSGRCYSDCVS